MKQVYLAAERLMQMDDTAWQRHANPWSAYTRFAMLPLLALACWSRVWLGWWAVIPLAAVLALIWFNPRAFPPPTSLDNWASRGVLGERVFLRHRSEIPAHHRSWADGLSYAALPGVLVFLAGLWWLDLPWTVFGMALIILPKVWFVDRMVWLYSDWLRENGRMLGDV